MPDIPQWRDPANLLQLGGTRYRILDTNFAIRYTANDYPYTVPCYEHTLGHGHHDHLKCVRCGTIFDFYERRIDEKQKEVCGKNGFTMLWHVHVIGGYCKKCGRTNRPRQRKPKPGEQQRDRGRRSWR
ncbi:MAG: transcriptional repressor [Candidatus Omnitrophota bacterium]